MEDLKYLNALALFPKFGSSRLRKIIRRFPSAEEAFKSPLKKLAAAGIEEDVLGEFALWRREIDPEAEWKKLGKENIEIIAEGDSRYPRLLGEIHNPPALLYAKGNCEKQDDFAVGIVGTRKITPYGRQVTPEIAGGLAASQVTVVSGLALGVDTLAHQEAIGAGGRTVAVLGSGLNEQNIYPFSNRRLARQITESGGLLLSEYPCGTPPLRQNFPQRNRIISGLSLGIVVIEAAEKSGALITAKFALDQNREIFAVPGSIYGPNSAGPNNLIKMGARPVTSAADILDALNLSQAASFSENKKILPDSQEEEILLRHLSREPVHIDRLAAMSGLDITQVSSTLTLMEMKGKVKDLGGMNYIIAR